MKFGVIGAGIVGQALAAKLAELNHEVMIGTRNVAVTLARTELGVYGNPPFRAWSEQHPQIQVDTFAQTAAWGEILLNAIVGDVSVEVLQTIGADLLNGKILIDVVQPSGGMPSSLLGANISYSLGEQIQRTFPQVKVVKALNSTSLRLMVNPRQVADGDHHTFVCGNDAQAKTQVIELLTRGFGWKHVIDLGDITAARGTEMILPLWLELSKTLQTALFNFKIVQE
jgi:predicted dinucleotide-binding enzyme